MGCGKTTAGKIAARRLGCGYADTDEIIVKRAGMTIPEIFEKKGESYFRRREAETIIRLCGKKSIISCGGGAMLNDKTAAAARENGFVIFLDTPFETCYNRIKHDRNRPIAAASTKEELFNRYTQRYEIYMRNSSIRIDASGSPSENAEAIIAAVKGYKK
jgi:shikimate kinase